MISLRSLREFWSHHADAEMRLRAWHKTVSRGTWASLAEIRATFGRATAVHEDVTIFDVGGDKYRIIAGVDYEKQVVYVKHVLTHADYDREAWKKDAKRPEKPEKPGKKERAKKPWTRLPTPGNKSVRKKKR